MAIFSTYFVYYFLLFFFTSLFLILHISPATFIVMSSINSLPHLFDPGKFSVKEKIPSLTYDAPDLS